MKCSKFGFFRFASICLVKNFCELNDMFSTSSEDSFPATLWSREVWANAL